MTEFLQKLDPIVALLVLGNAAQWWAYQKQQKAMTDALSGQTIALNKITDRLDHKP